MSNGFRKAPGKKRHAGLFVLVLLTGCSLTQACGTQDVQTRMLGMSENEIGTCVGVPIKKSVEGQSEIWSYMFGSCALKLEVANDRVRSVNYTETGKDVSEDEQCASIPEVTGCLRWLRRSALFQ